MAHRDETATAAHDAERLQLQEWLRLSFDERRVAIDLVRELAKEGNLDRLRELLKAQPQISSMVAVGRGIGIVSAALMKGAALISALGVLALAWKQATGKG